VYVNNRNNDFGYDAAGNVTYDTVRYYNYDAENRLWRVDNGAVRYQYDAEGRRVKKITGSETTYYVYGQIGLLSEFTIGTGTAQASVNDKRVYRVAEQTGTSVLLLAVDGTLIEENRVLPYGEPWQSTSPDNEGKFTSYLRDAETGNDYAMERYYASRSGRFLTSDPGNAGAILQNPQTWNGYVYAANDPINFGDPTGAYRVRIQGPSDCWSSLGGSVEEVSLGLESWTEVVTTQVGGQTVTTETLRWREVFEYYCNYSVSDVPIVGSLADTVADTAVRTREFVEPMIAPVACTALSTAKGALIGGVAGAAVGATVGGFGGTLLFSPTGPGALVGGAGGVLAGATAGANAGMLSGAIVGGVHGLTTCFKDHSKGPRRSTKERHQAGRGRRQKDRGGEKGDERRRPPRNRPDGWKGPWPPPPGTPWW
jgi:RHS repeat-associated protein